MRKTLPLQHFFLMSRLLEICRFALLNLSTTTMDVLERFWLLKKQIGYKHQSRR